MILKLISGAALAALLAGSASADNADAINGRRAMAEFGTCLAANAPAQASRAVVEDWGSDQIRADRFFKPSHQCLWSQGYATLYGSAATVKAAMAEALIRRENMTVGTLLSVAPLTYRLPTPLRTVDARGKPLPEKSLLAQKAAIAGKMSVIMGERIGECLVRADAARARALVTAPLDGDAEKAAATALAPSLPGCVDKGRTVELTQASLRGVVALAYYRLAKAEAGTVWAGDAS